MNHIIVMYKLLVTIAIIVIGTVFKSTVMRKTAKAFNISGWLFFSLVAKSKVPIHTSYLPH
jgi:hypothetical protein